jgi:hypothetical protein
METQVVVPGARRDEAAVVIRRGKAPGPVAAFDRQQDDGVFALGNAAEWFVDGGDDRGIEARAERAPSARSPLTPCARPSSS